MRDANLVESQIQGKLEYPQLRSASVFKFITGRYKRRQPPLRSTLYFPSECVR